MSIAISDGRDIDSRSGILSGEASGQKVEHDGTASASIGQETVSGQVPSSQYNPADLTYYDHPLLKEPTWIWTIPAYFYVGGATGMSVVLGSAGLAFGRGRMQKLTLASRWIGVGGGVISAALLIHDLGRPERFLNMLRVFRPSSPMSMGSWILTAFSTLIGGALVGGLLPWRFTKWLADAGHHLAGLFGFGLSGYTAVLIAQTAVPAWQMGRLSLPALFLSSGSSAAVSLFEMLELNETERMAVERFGRVAKWVEVASSHVYELELERVPRVARPLSSGPTSILWKAGKILGVATAVLSTAPFKKSKRQPLMALLGTLASLTVRFAVFELGKVSARDSRATFHQQRSGFGAREISAPTPSE